MDMTKEQREQILTNAREACKRLSGYEVSAEELMRFQERTYPSLGFFFYSLDELVDQVIDGFNLLDAKEQEQIKAGKKYGKLGAKYGKKGGRPKKNIT